MSRAGLVNSQGKVKPQLLHILQQLDSRTREIGRDPLVKEVVGWFDDSHQAIRYRLDRLVDNGLVRYMGPGRDVVIVTENGCNAARTGFVPKPMPQFDGGVHAGARETEVEPNSRWIRCLADIFNVQDWDCDYFAPVVGDCMMGMRGGRRPIYPGDIVFFHTANRWNRPVNGSLVHIELAVGNCGQTEALLRDYYFDEETGLVTLVPRNSSYEPTTLPDADVDLRGWSSEWKSNDFINDEALETFLKDVRAEADLYLPMQSHGGNLV
jgi:hypothetical protein